MHIIVYACSYLITVAGGHFFVRLILLKHRSQFSGGLPGAGALIGILERIFTLTFVLIGEYTAITLILAAKSIARFEELKERSFAEYFLIGTFSSILSALLIGLATRWLLIS